MQTSLSVVVYINLFFLLTLKYKGCLPTLSKLSHIEFPGCIQPRFFSINDFLSQTFCTCWLLFDNPSKFPWYFRNPWIYENLLHLYFSGKIHYREKEFLSILAGNCCSGWGSLKFHWKIFHYCRHIFVKIDAENFWISRSMVGTLKGVNSIHHINSFWLIKRFEFELILTFKFKNS